MAVFNATLCQNVNKVYSVNFNVNTPSIGEVWNTSDINDKIPYCVTITTGVTDGSSTKLLTTQYTDCYDCLSNNYGTVAVTSCIFGRYTLTLESFGFLPTIGATYYLSFLITSPREGTTLITACVTVDKEGIRQLS